MDAFRAELVNRLARETCETAATQRAAAFLAAHPEAHRHLTVAEAADTALYGPSR